MLKSLVNGQEADLISVQDRGLLYGHSLFETIAVKNGHALCLDEHLLRLEKGAIALGIPCDRDLIQREVLQMVGDSSRVILRVMLTIGSGGRGYASPQDPIATRILTLHEWPVDKGEASHSLRVGIASHKLSCNAPLAGHKHSNRLDQVLIRNAWEDHWDEALVMDQNDQLIEATQANVFVRFGEVVLTPKLDHAGVAGIMRGLILQNAYELPFTIREETIPIRELVKADEVVLTNSIIGARVVGSIEANTLELNKTFAANEFKLKTQLISLLEQHGAI